MTMLTKMYLTNFLSFKERTEFDFRQIEGLVAERRKQ